MIGDPVYKGFKIDLTQLMLEEDEIKLLCKRLKEMPVWQDKGQAILPDMMKISSRDLELPIGKISHVEHRPDRKCIYFIVVLERDVHNLTFDLPELDLRKQEYKGVDSTLQGLNVRTPDDNVWWLDFMSVDNFTKEKAIKNGKKSWWKFW